MNEIPLTSKFKSKKGEQPSSLAKAIVSRRRKEDQWKKNALSLNGIPPHDVIKTSQKSPFDTETSEALFVDELMKKEPKGELTKETLMTTVVTMSENGWKKDIPLKERIIIALIPPAKRLAEGIVHATRHSQIDVATKLLPELPSDITWLINATPEAEALGKDKNLPPESVYRDDVLYSALVRRAFSPDKLVTDLETVHDPNTVEEIEQKLDAELARVYNQPTKTIYRNKKTKKQMDSALEKVQKIADILAISTITRFWEEEIPLPKTDGN
jgi:hypothetical protein